MRIAISALSVKPDQTGGGETVMVNLLRSLPSVDPDFEYIVFLTQENQSLFSTTNSNVTRHVVPGWVCNPVFRVIYELLFLPIALRRWQVECFLAMNQVFSPLIWCPTLVLVQNLLFYHFRDLYGSSRLGLKDRCNLELRNIYFSFLNGISNRRATRVIAVSEVVKGEIVRRDRISPTKVSVIPLAVSTTFDSPKSDDGENIPISGPFFLYVGAWEPYKNIDKAILALARLREREHCNDVRMVIIGLDVHNYGKDLRACAQESRINNAVHFIGPTPHSELGVWYRHSKALIQLSACEAFPLTPFEAMANGTPVIGSIDGAVAEIVGEGGLLVDSSDIDEIAATMHRILIDERFALEQIARGYRRVGQYTWTRTANQISSLLRTVIKPIATRKVPT